MLTESDDSTPGGYDGYRGRLQAELTQVLHRLSWKMTNVPHRVLIVEDDAQLASMVADFLASEGFETSIEGHGDRAPERILREAPDAVVLDIGLPGLDGFEICRQVRSQYDGAILMLTARGEEVDEVVGLQVGADDYMAKPVRPRALLARLRGHLRKHRTPDTGKPIDVGSIKIDPASRTVMLSDERPELTTAEFDLLMLLAEKAGQVLSRSEIYPKLYGIKYDGLDRSLDLRVSRLRKKLGDDPARPKRVKSVRGVGYLLSIEP